VFEGGGFSLSDKQRVFDYAYTTWDALPEAPQGNEWPRFVPDQGSRPIKGEGFGLPMIRQFAKFFGGDLQLVPVCGHGTDAYLRLPNLNPGNLHRPLPPLAE
jgi:pyruvate dehydrogenase kinase 2/3/4